MVGLARETPGDGPVVTHIGTSGFRTRDRRYTGGLLLTPHSEASWNAPALCDLILSDIDVALAIKPAPEFLLLGTGIHLAHPPAAFKSALEAIDIGLEVMDSAAAARAWSLLRSESRWIAAVLYPLA